MVELILLSTIFRNIYRRYKHMGLIEFKLRVKRKRDKVSAGDLIFVSLMFYDYLSWMDLD